jgi:hypothetical protein
MAKSKKSQHTDKKPENDNEPKPPTTTKHVAEQVLAILGKPEHHYDSVVTFYPGNKARINVRCRHGDYEIKIADSFYLWLDNNGVVIKSNPPIKQRYEQAS